MCGERRDMLAKTKDLAVDSRGDLLLAIPLIDARVFKAMPDIEAIAHWPEAFDHRR